MVIKEAKTDELELPGLSSFISVAYNDCVEQSNVVYVDIVSLPADSKDTVLRVLNKLHRIFIVEEGIRWLVVVGDAKTYDILQNLRREYMVVNCSGCCHFQEIGTFFTTIRKYC